VVASRGKDYWEAALSIQNLESAGAADPGFDLTPEQVHDLANEAGDLLREGERCAQAGCWRAAVVMVAAAVETCPTEGRGW
jgi:hypothetical protein